MDSPWVYIYRPNDEIVYDVLCLAAPKERRTVLKSLLRGAVFAVNVAYWLKGFV